MDMQRTSIETPRGRQFELMASARTVEPPSLPAAGDPGGFGPPAADEANGVEDIRAVLREEICLLDHAPGSALSENAMAKRFDTSRTVIKRVFYGLEYDGLVESIAGVGTIVTSIDLVYLQQVYALRFKLTELVADFSAGRVTEEHLERMRQLANAAEALRGAYDYRELARLYMYFAQEFGQAIGNRPFLEIMDRLFYQTSRVYLQVLPDMEWEQEVDIAVQEMRDIAAAMEAKDMAQVARIRRYHMAWNLRRFNHYLSSAIFDVDPTQEFEFEA
ncbi:MAG TPA: GntR family transcriptional regulator [Trueperaceae bacterium]